METIARRDLAYSLVALSPSRSARPRSAEAGARPAAAADPPAVVATSAARFLPAPRLGLPARDPGGERAELLVHLLLWAGCWLMILICLRHLF